MQKPKTRLTSFSPDLDSVLSALVDESRIGRNVWIENLIAGVPKYRKQFNAKLRELKIKLEPRSDLRGKWKRNPQAK